MTQAGFDQYKQLLAEREALDRKLNELRSAERSTVIAEVREKIAAYQLTAEDLFTSPKTRRAYGGVVAPKYKNPLTGETWTGRGKPPTWIRDHQDRTQFLIKAA